MGDPRKVHLMTVRFEPLLTLEEAAERFACTPRALREMALRGDVPSRRAGKGPRARLRFLWSELLASTSTKAGR